MLSLSRAVVVCAAVACAATASEAQERSSAERAYFGAVARFFQMPEGEVTILASWDLPPDEIPVVLFVARRAVVSPEALVALRESGRSWPDLADRYNIGANALHVPLRDPASAGTLTAAYERFRDTPVAEWSHMRLSEDEIVALVNARVLSQALGIAPDEVVRRTGTTGDFVELYAQLVR